MESASLECVVKGRNVCQSDRNYLLQFKTNIYDFGDLKNQQKLPTTKTNNYFREKKTYPFRDDGEILEPITKTLGEQRDHTSLTEPQIGELDDDDGDEESGLGCFESFNLVA